MSKWNLVFIPRTSIGRILILLFVFGPVIKHLSIYASSQESGVAFFVRTTLASVVDLIASYLVICFVRGILVLIGLIRNNDDKFENHISESVE